MRIPPSSRHLRARFNGDTEEVREWGERVSRELYDRIGKDYAADRVIVDNVFGTKRRGYLEPDNRYESSGRITRW